MNNKTGDNNGQSDVDFVRSLAELLRDNDLTELEVEREAKGGAKLTVRLGRGAQTVQVAAPAPVMAPAAPAAASVAAPAPTAAAPAEAAPAANAISSPMVGTAYLSPEPGAENFVKVGDKVSEGQTLLIIEAMKTMNHIPSPRSGTVREVIVTDGSPVEFGAPLMVVE